MKTTIQKRTFQAIYKLLDMVSPLPVDCGILCGSACCTQEDDAQMGIYLYPGEEKLFTKTEDWLEWEADLATDYDFPENWTGKVYFVKCKNAPCCDRKMRPLQCRMFPVLPHYQSNGQLVLILNDIPLPYTCPLIKDNMRLTPPFLKATYTVWRRLVEDPLYHSLVEYDSAFRDEDNVTVVYTQSK